MPIVAPAPAAARRQRRGRRHKTIPEDESLDHPPRCALGILNGGLRARLYWCGSMRAKFTDPAENPHGIRWLRLEWAAADLGWETFRTDGPGRPGRLRCLPILDSELVFYDGYCGRGGV